ncbi:2Fe-2S iron-sulfur cluster-binding protein [Deinococcus multiflagellatus]|uniref:2Fe-2S iron-sulfur cluster-binding protein n=1 Tax=Deinococcus multiflagellatus TaxID=1656887 RepID=A0ABW1ZIP9_9DEIO
MKVTVDGHELDLPAGTSAIDAVFESGGDVPYFCAHPYLSPVGACRMCLVESGSPRKNPDGSFVMEGEGTRPGPRFSGSPSPWRRAPCRPPRACTSAPPRPATWWPRRRPA